MKKLSNDDFISRSINIHKDRYDYSLTFYKNSLFKVKIICRVHGIFEMKPYHHIDGHGCKKCSDEKIKYNTMTTDQFIIKSKEVHGDVYDYTNVKYTGTHKNVQIICPKHGIFEQLPSNHLRKIGCPSCYGNKKFNNIEFIKNAKDVHGDKYDYSLIEYKNNNTKIKIICPKHGIFEKIPSSHINNLSGCPSCKLSKGENKIMINLDKLKINYIKQFRFDDCKDKINLPFDFYLPEHNICIEFDGKQHFKPVERFGGKDYFDILKKHDDIKNNYCLSKKINLLRINNIDEIENKIKEIINENKI